MPRSPLRLRKLVQPFPEPLLARTRSTGPTEATDYRSEFHNGYLAADLDVMLLLALVRKGNPASRLVCVPNYYATMDDPSTVRFTTSRDPHAAVSVRGGIVVTDLQGGDPRLHMHPDTRSILDRCARRGLRFVFFNTGLYWRTHGHSNAVIFDLKEQTIERYEPAGARGRVRGLRAQFLRHFPEWRWIGARHMPVGAQGLADSFEGLCVTFSLYYALLRVSNPDETPDAVYRAILREHARGTLTDKILRLNRFAADTLRTLRRGTLDAVRTKK